MGSYEHVNQYIPGTRFSDMIGPINQYGHTGGFYVIQTATSQGQFNNFIGSDIYLDRHPLITDIRTQGNVPGFGYEYLNGWSNVNVDHIVAIWGFNFVTPGAGYIQYVEGSSAAAGNTAQGRNNYSADPFRGLVEDNSNPGQIW
jgi:hypothetical protein